ncbi:hypothetical protein IV37_GL000185 [Fructilactobacillus fructivorans]|nr:hypothetical protein IV37_GL000185 [Fructilactobacillus fructivorans]
MNLTSFFVPEERTGDQPSYPYITYSPVVAHKQLYFNDYNSKPFELVYQLKCVSDAKAESLGMVDWLRRLFYLENPSNKLLAHGVALETVEDMVNTDVYFNIDWQFSNGLTMTFMIQPNFIDDTQN